MNLVLLLFALPFATIIFSIVLQKIIKSPILVALTVFSIYLILALTVFNESFLVLAILYTILSYITASITRLIKKFIKRCLLNSNNTDNGNSCEQDECGENDSINDESGCGCGCNRSALVLNGNYKNYNKRYWK